MALSRETRMPSTYLVLATIRDDTDMAALASLVPDELAAVERLRDEGALGAVHIAFARRVIFIEVFADTEEEVRNVVDALPMGRFFDLDLYRTDPPGVPDPAAEG